MAIKWTDEVEREALRLRREGKTYREVAEVLGCSGALVVSHIGEAARRKRAHRRDKTERFAVGDRVVYHPNVYGNADIDGWVGTIIYIDHTAIPYTVRFDVAWCGGMSEERVAAKDSNSMRCWYCREENLSLLADASHSVKKKESETADMSRIKWTESMDLRVREMATAGKSASEIAAVLYIKKEQVYSRLAYLKQKGYVIGGLDGRTMPRMEKDAPAPMENIAGPAGQLNDLEAAMAETIRELTSERDNLAERLAVYEHDYGDAVEEIERMRALLAEKAEEAERLSEAVEDREAEVARVEIQLDEARREAAAHLAKVGEQIKVISSMEKRVSELEGELEGANEDVITMQETIALRNEDIDELTERLERAARRAGELLTQCLMMGE